MPDKFDKHILKDRLKKELQGKQVIAAVFYTFNFEPEFFENYLLPILVGEHDFTNNKILNSVVWRRLQADGKIPKISVHYDDRVKSTKAAPQLKYDLIAHRSGSLHHPKISFILCQNEKQQELIFICGSNNLSKSGWCKNLEAVFFQSLVSGAFSNDFQKQLKKIVNADKSGRAAELLVHKFLNQRKKYNSNPQTKHFFYHSESTSFLEFIKNNIPQKEPIKRIEILSPFWDSECLPILNLLKEYNAEIFALIPFRKGTEVQLDNAVFEKYRAYGLQWSEFVKKEEDKTYLNRYNHSKVYRFYGDRRVYTIVGSVNCTRQGWSKHDNTRTSNIEAAVLTSELNKHSCLLESRKNFTDLNFNPEPVEEDDGASLFVELTPEIYFTIDWAEEAIFYETKSKGHFVLDLETHKCDLNTNRGEKTISLKDDRQTLKILSKNPLLKVIETKGEKQTIHYYYPTHENIEKKLLDIKLTVKDLLKLWELTGEMSNYLANMLEANAEIWEDALVHLNDATQPIAQGVINKMAAHLHALKRLEQRFEEHLEDNQTEKLYYLTTDNVDTLVNYRKRIIDWSKEENGGMNKGFVWLLLSIIKEKFYQTKRDDDLKIKREKKILVAEIEGLRKQLNGLTPQKLEWVNKMIKSV